MVLRKSDCRLAALAVVCSMTASLATTTVPAGAQTTRSVEVPSTGARMTWGGRLPEPGESYRPSVGRRDGTGFGSSPADSPAQNAAPSYPTQPTASLPEPVDEGVLLDDLVGRQRPSTAAAAPAMAAPAGFAAAPLAPPPLAPPVSIEPPSAQGFGTDTAAGDPWSGLKAVTPSVGIPGAPARQPRGRVASLGRPDLPPVQPSLPGRGALQPETPEGYILLPKREAMCRVALKKMGVKYTDISPVGSSKSCGIPHPVKVTQITEGVAMKPAATLNCDAAFRISQWVENEVKPAARWRLWTSPTAVLNASSYRCSRIAGSRTVSEHASGNALDVRGFEFSNGDVFDVEKKGFFSFRQKGFQKSVRRSACEHFGTVLGPGYNYDHRDHLHLDAKNRRRVVCK